MSEIHNPAGSLAVGPAASKTLPEGSLMKGAILPTSSWGGGGGGTSERILQGSLQGSLDGVGCEK